MQKDMLWDPLRRKSVKATPEEEVRQWFISAVLHQGMKVPEHMMGSEVPLKQGLKDFRADIVVYDRSAAPLMIVECKRLDVVLDQEVIDQAIRYNNVLNVKYIAITNGAKTFMFRRDGEGFVYMERAPLWEEML